MNARTSPGRVVLALVLLGTGSLPVWAASPQTITFDAIPNQILGVSPFPVAAGASSGLPLTLTPLLPAVCSMAGDLVVLRSVGTCTITASQTGNGSFSAATSVTRTFTVSQAKVSGSFAAAAGSPFAVGSGPYFSAVGDFNGDSIPDLAVANFSDSSVTVLLGNGSGGFTAATGSPFAAGAGPIFVAVGDFNGDGKQDLAISNNDGGNITVLLGDGSGGFTAATGSPFGAGSQPYNIAVGDFNNDGSQDLAIANYNDSTVTVLLGNGTGGFTQATGSPVAVSGGPTWVVAGDFNADGSLDLATANYDNSTVTVLLGNSTGGFVVGSSTSVGLNPWSLAVGDFNGDGIQDLVTANYNDGTVTVLLGQGPGTFTAAAGSPFAVGTDPQIVVVGDFNGDGIQDLATSNWGSSNVTVLLGNGSGGFAPMAGSPLAVRMLPEAVAVADFNGDGILDLATSNDTNNITVLLGTVVGSTSQTITFGALSNVTNGVSPFTISAAASSGLAVSFASTTSSVCTVAGTTITILDGGTCSIIASQAGNATYAAATSVTRSFVVNPEPQTITFGPLGVASLGISPFDVSATASSGFLVSFASTTSSVCTVAGSTVTIVAVGTCSITASQAGNSAYAAATPVTQSFMVVASTTTYVLTTAISPPGTGTIAITPALPNNYAVAGTTVCLTATPVAGQIFTGWTGTALNAAGCLTMTASASVTANFEANPISATSALRFVPVTPCRLVDTRNPAGPLGGPSIGGQTTRSFTIPGTCNIPSTALAYSLNLTVVPHGALGYVTMWPTGQTQPVVSTLNSLDGRIKSNAAIVPAGTGGAVSVFATDATDAILDINGYFDSYTDTSALQFYPLTPCRVADTRSATGSLGGPSLVGSQSRSFPIMSSACNIPGNALAYSLNFTAIPRGPLGYLTVWPSGQSQPVVSTLNAPTGAITANAAIVPAGTGGAIQLFATDSSDMAIDINGYFAAPAIGGLSLYNLTPCRIEDTRNPSGTPAFTGTVTETATGVACGVPPEAQSLVLNATVVPSGALGYLSLWANGGSQPVVSTLNSLDGSVTSNMAVVPTTNGLVNAYAAGPGSTYLILDTSGYFAP